MPVITYRETPFIIENNGHTIELVPAAAGNRISIDGYSYELQQFHFHAPSEHLIDGAAFAMELHLVHADAQGNLAVIGIMIVQGARNETLGEVFENMPPRIKGINTAGQALHQKQIRNAFRRDLRPPAAASAASRRVLNPSFPHSLDHARASTVAISLRSSITGEGVAEPQARINLADLFAGNEEMYRYEGSLTTPPCTEGVKWSVSARPITLSPRQIGAFRALYQGNNRPVQNRYDRRVYAAVP
jgi:carbonic anhydrase